jgi:hypothetical protein
LPGIAISVPTAALDAVRLDVVHAQLWGRAERARNVLLIASEAGAPLIFGYLADTVGGAARRRSEAAAAACAPRDSAVAK